MFIFQITERIKDPNPFKQQDVLKTPSMTLEQRLSLGVPENYRDLVKAIVLKGFSEKSTDAMVRWLARMVKSLENISDERVPGMFVGLTPLTVRDDAAFHFSIIMKSIIEMGEKDAVVCMRNLRHAFDDSEKTVLERLKLLSSLFSDKEFRSGDWMAQKTVFLPNADVMLLATAFITTCGKLDKNSLMAHIEDKKSDMARVLPLLGISSLEEFDVGALIESYRVVSERGYHDASNRLTAITYGKYYWDQSGINGDRSDLSNFLAQDSDIILFQAEFDAELFERMRNFGFLESGRGNCIIEGKPSYSNWAIVAHAEQFSIELSTVPGSLLSPVSRELRDLDTQDASKLGGWGALKDVFTRDAVIAVLGCSGADETKAPVPILEKNIKNIAEWLLYMTGAHKVIGATGKNIKDNVAFNVSHDLIEDVKYKGGLWFSPSTRYYEQK